MDEAQTPEQIAQHYKAMGDSVWFINAVIAGTLLTNEVTEEKKAAVDRNVLHLEQMVAKDFWTTEDMTEVNAAIVAGKSYLA